MFLLVLGAEEEMIRHMVVLSYELRNAVRLQCQGNNVMNMFYDSFEVQVRDMHIKAQDIAHHHAELSLQFCPYSNLSF